MGAITIQHFINPISRVGCVNTHHTMEFAYNKTFAERPNKRCVFTHPAKAYIVKPNTASHPHFLYLKTCPDNQGKR